MAELRVATLYPMDPSNSQNIESFQPPLMGQKGKLILTLTITISKGRTDSLNVHEGEIPEYLAEDFVHKHRLPVQLKNTITDSIIENLDKIQFERQQNMKDLEHGFKKNFKGKKKKNESASSSQTGNEADSYNYGTWLYLRDKKQLKDRNTRIEVFKLQQEQQEYSELTFNPKVNLGPRRRLKSKPEDILLQKAKERRDRLESLKNQALEKLNHECTFKPEITKLARSMSRNRQHSRSASQSRFDELYRDATERRDRVNFREMSTNWKYSFTPSISQKARERSTSGSRSETFERLSKNKSEYYLKMQEVKESLTPKQSFTPRLVSRQPQKRDNGGQLFEFLHIEGRIRKMRDDEYERMKIIETDSDVKSARSSSSSQKVFRKYQDKQFHSLFSSMDTDNDGEISVENIYIEHLDNQTLSLLEPLFLELEKNPMNYSKFSLSLSRLLPKLTIQERAILLKRRNNDQMQTQLSTMSNASSFTSRQRREIAEKVTNRLMRPKTRPSVQESEKEDSECTFKPSITVVKKNRRLGKK